MALQLSVGLHAGAGSNRLRQTYIWPLAFTRQRASMTPLDHLLGRLEERVGRFWCALLIGCMWAIAAALFVGPGLVPAFHGEEYSDLSQAPFDLTISSRLRYRILGPLIGYLLGLRGAWFLVVPWIFLVLFLGTIYNETRRTDLSPTLALLASGSMAFSCVTFIPLVAPGYTDPITYFFVLLAFARIGHIGLSAGCLALAIANHEAVLFLLPGFLCWWWIRTPDVMRMARYGFVLGLALVPYLAYRYWVSVHHSTALDVAYYFSEANRTNSMREITPTALWGIFAAFRLFWIFPIVAVLLHLRRRRWIHVAFYVVTLFGVLFQLLIAFDTTRMLCLGFPLVLVGIWEVAHRRGWPFATRLALACLLLDLFVPATMVGSNQIVHLRH